MINAQNRMHELLLEPPVATSTVKPDSAEAAPEKPAWREPEHHYDGREIMANAACEDCGYKPWLEPWRPCTESTVAEVQK